MTSCSGEPGGDDVSLRLPFLSVAPGSPSTPRHAAGRRGEARLALVWGDRGFGPRTGNPSASGPPPRAGFFVVTCSTLYPDEGEARLAPTKKPTASVSPRNLRLQRCDRPHESRKEVDPGPQRAQPEPAGNAGTGDLWDRDAGRRGSARSAPRGPARMRRRVPPEQSRRRARELDPGIPRDLRRRRAE